jgi:hypothetical protein
MPSFPKLAILAVISRAYCLKPVDAFVSSDTSKLPLHVALNIHQDHQKLHYSSHQLSKLMAEKRAGNNPFQSFLGDMASSIVSNVAGGGGGDSNKNEDLDRKLSEIQNLSSWGEIQTMLSSKQTDEEKSFRLNVEKGIGRASPLNKVRLFDESNKEEDIRVVLYRDSASWCPCKKVNPPSFFPFISISVMLISCILILCILVLYVSYKTVRKFG